MGRGQAGLPLDGMSARLPARAAATMKSPAPLLQEEEAAAAAEAAALAGWRRLWLRELGAGPALARRRGSPDSLSEAARRRPRRGAAAKERAAAAAGGGRALPPPAPGPYAAPPGRPQPSPPRKRLAEAAAAAAEGRALQQSRRLLANARERTRVHTISAAFEALRKQVPCYSYGQKLSKLAILRIACNYILSLARLADLDYSADHSNLSFSECVEQCTRTLQAEGRSKKRKE